MIPNPKQSSLKVKKNAEKRLWKLTIVAEEPEDITAVDDENSNDMSAQVRKSDVLGKRKVCMKFV